MAWQQRKPFNQSKAGKNAGLCLQNTRLGYSIAAKYSNANAARANTVLHRDRNIPLGVDVPLFFTYKNDGHVNVRLANGTVWSDGRIYGSLNDYENRTTPVYVGWGETLNNVRVIQYVNAPQPSTQPKGGMPAVGSQIQIPKGDTRTVYRAGKAIGTIYASDGTYKYTVRAIDGRWITMNSAKFGGQVQMALFYQDGSRISGWVAV